MRTFFHTKVFCAAFLYLHFRFVLFGAKIYIGTKAALKMLVKLTLIQLLATQWCKKVIVEITRYPLLWNPQVSLPLYCKRNTKIEKNSGYYALKDPKYCYYVCFWLLRVYCPLTSKET
jgi:hypothetical protein